MKINFCSAPCRSGKTYQLITTACQIAEQGDIVVFLQPTKELVDKTIETQLLRQFTPPPYEKFYGNNLHHSVAWKLSEYLKTPMDGGHIIFATHQVIPHVRFWANKSRLHVIVDEELQVVKHGCFRIPHTHKLITDYVEPVPHDAIYSRIIVKDHAKVEHMAKNPASDEIYERFRETAQILTNPYWESFVNSEQFEKLKAGKVQQLSIHSILNPEVLNGFASVTMASANFEDTILYRLWNHLCIRFEENKDLCQQLLFQQHHNGHLVSIKYLTDGSWSKKLQGTRCEPHNKMILDVLRQAIKREFGSDPFLWQANKSISDGVFGENGRRLPNVPHGLNDYSDFDRIAFLSALNPRSDHFRFLETRGVEPQAVRRAIYCLAAYQSVMRTSIRDPESTTQKVIIVPDFNAARYLTELFPRSQIEKLQTNLIEPKSPGKLGRPRKYHCSNDRKREYRLKKNLSNLKTVLRLESFPYVAKNSCGEREKETSMIGDEKGIDIITHFVSHDGHHGTLYRDKKSNAPSGYLSGGNADLFIAFLEHLHSRTQEHKQASPLISPAIFDPNHPRAEGKTKRGENNIVAMRHLWMDFENGDLQPEDLSELFPRVRMVVFNTYNHTNEAPRFRVVVPFDEAISAADYTVFYDNVIAKILDAGYTVGQSKERRRSGLDISKTTSLFYLPCQARDQSQSFFKDYNDHKRKLLSPKKWIENTVVPFQRKTSQEPQELRGPVNQAAVEKATELWQQSPQYPGEGNARFFDFALSLKSAGMTGHFHWDFAIRTLSILSNHCEWSITGISLGRNLLLTMCLRRHPPILFVLLALA